MICFIGVNFKSPGGLQTLIINIAKGLNDTGEKIKFFGITNSYVYINLVNKGIQFEFIDTKKIKKENIYKQIKVDDVFIITNYIPELENIKKANPRIVFWNIFPKTLLTFNNYKRFKSKFLNKRIINTFLKSNSLFFMDTNCVKAVNEFYSINVKNPTLIPIPIEYSDNKYITKLINTINVTYIGRAVNWKIYPLIKVLEDLEFSNNIKINIVTDNIDFLRNSTSKYEKHLNIDYKNNLSPSELRNFLIDKSDLNIGMGTTCLESAILGIPTLIVDPSYDNLPKNYRYSWIFEKEIYNLGNIIKKEEYNAEGHLLQNILNKLKLSNEYRRNISTQCYKYVFENHNINNIVSDLIIHINNSKLRFRDFYRFLLKRYSMNLFNNK